MVQGIGDALAISAGGFDAKGQRGGKKVVDVHPSAVQFLGKSPSELVREFAILGNVPNAARMAKQQLFEAVGRRSAAGFTTSGNFSNALLNSMNKLVTAGYAGFQGVTTEFFDTLTANDLRAHNLYKSGSLESLQEVNEAGEVPAINRADAKYEILTPTEWAGMLSIPDRVFINDDLGELSRIPTEFGEAAARTVEKLNFYRLVANAAMNEDAVACFSEATHVNLNVTAATPPSVAALDTAFGAMSIQKNRAGEPIGIVPDIILVPPALLSTAQQIINSQFVPGNSANISNPYSGALRIISSPYLATGGTIKRASGDLTFTGNSRSYYLLSSRLRVGATAFYGGTAPQITQEVAFETLGLRTRAVLRVGATLQEWRSAYKFTNPAN
jgi:hypothetical protein